MNRKQFLKRLGLFFGAAIVAPEVLALNKKIPPPNNEGDWWFAGDKETLPRLDNEFTITVENTSDRSLKHVSVTGFMYTFSVQDVVYKVNGNNVTQNAVKRIFAQPAIYENFTVKTNTNTLPEFYLHAWESSVDIPTQIYKPVFAENNYDFILDLNSILVIKELPPGAIMHFTFKVKAKRQPILVITGCQGVGKSYEPQYFNKINT